MVLMINVLAASKSLGVSVGLFHARCLAHSCSIAILLISVSSVLYLLNRFAIDGVVIMAVASVVFRTSGSPCGMDASMVCLLM